MKEQKTITQKLSIIQTEMNAPKNLYNAFGKYKYRNLEGITEAVKPFLKDLDCAFTVTDQMIQLGDRYYIEATATLLNAGSPDGRSFVSCKGYAREAEIKKGMDEAQITGSASSYARKYAANGLFAIDDTKDPDSTNTHGKGEAPENPAPKQSAPPTKKEPEAKKPLTPDVMEKMKGALQKDKKAITDVRKALEGRYEATKEQKEELEKLAKQ